MGIGEWLLAGLVAIVFAFVILRPDLWGRRGRGSSQSDGGTAVGVDGTGRRNNEDHDADDGGDGGDGGDGD